MWKVKVEFWGKMKVVSFKKVKVECRILCPGKEAKATETSSKEVGEVHLRALRRFTATSQISF